MWCALVIIGFFIGPAIACFYCGIAVVEAAGHYIMQDLRKMTKCAASKVLNNLPLKFYVLACEHSVAVCV